MAAGVSLCGLPSSGLMHCIASRPISQASAAYEVDVSACVCHV